MQRVMPEPCEEAGLERREQRVVHVGSKTNRIITIGGEVATRLS
jgi:hypothetical protein